MGIVITSFVVVFLLLASAGLLLFYRQAMLQRIASVISPAVPVQLRSSIAAQRVALNGLVTQLDRVVPKSKNEVSVVGTRLVRAGYRDESAIKYFYSAKLLTPLTLCLFAQLSGLSQSGPFFAFALCLGLGYILPDFWLGRKIKARQEAIRLGLPEVLDFLVICIEAGLSVDQATKRTAEELHYAHPAISDELDVLVLEQRAGRARSEAWKQFAERSDVESVRRLVSVLVQSEQLGTSIARTLRVHSDQLRMQRRQMIEEKAAKTTVKLVFPLVFFIFPSLFLVTLGPEAILIGESFAKYFNQ
jgi:tight adherence protein C